MTRHCVSRAIEPAHTHDRKTGINANEKVAGTARPRVVGGASIRTIPEPICTYSDWMRPYYADIRPIIACWGGENRGRLETDYIYRLQGPYSLTKRGMPPEAKLM